MLRTVYRTAETTKISVSHDDRGISLLEGTIPLKIILATQDVPMYLASLLDDFLDMLSKSGHVVEGIVVSSPYTKNSVIREIRYRYELYGLVDFLRMSFRVLKNRSLSFVFEVSHLVGCHSVGNVVKKYGIKTYYAESVNSKGVVKFVATSDIDLMISIASPEVFRGKILKAPQKGCINYHTALLPKYRGRQPLFWALLNDEKEVGISIHEMDESIDSGAIIVQTKVSVSPEDSLHSLYLKTIEIGPRLLLEAIKKLITRITPMKRKLAVFVEIPSWEK